MPPVFPRPARSTGLFLFPCLSLTATASAQLTNGTNPIGTESLGHKPAMGVAVANLQGMVRTDGGANRGLHAVAQIKNVGGEVIAEETVGANGEFFFEDLPKATYYLTVAARGYVSSTEVIDLNLVGNMYFVSITLTILNPAETLGTTSQARTDATAPKKARTEWEKGTRAVKAGKLSEALEDFQKAVEIYPCYARAQADLAAVLMRGRNAAQAETPLRKAIACDPDYAEPYLRLGRLLNALSRYSDSRAVLAEGIRRSPSTWQLYYTLAEADEGTNNLHKAEEEFLKAKSFGPTQPAIMEKLADVYLKEKSYDKAYAEMQAYLAAAPAGRYAAKMKGVMQQLEAKGLVHPNPTQGSFPPST